MADMDMPKNKEDEEKDDTFYPHLKREINL